MDEIDLLIICATALKPEQGINLPGVDLVRWWMRGECLGNKARFEEVLRHPSIQWYINHNMAEISAVYYRDHPVRRH